MISIYQELIGHGVVFKSHIHASYLLAVFIFVTMARYQITKQYYYLSCVLIALTTVYLCFFSTGRLGYIIIFIMVNFFCYRFWHWRGFDPPRFIGQENVKLFHDKENIKCPTK